MNDIAENRGIPANNQSRSAGTPSTSKHSHPGMAKHNAAIQGHVANADAATRDRPSGNSNSGTAHGTTRSSTST